MTPSMGAIRETIRLIYRIFPLRQSRDRLDGTALRRPCLNYQMGRCLAPCAGYLTKEEYGRVVQDVILFLKGKNQELVESLPVWSGEGRDSACHLSGERYNEVGIF